MEKINTILDRKPINSEYINSKQDFNKVMDGFQQLKPPVYKQGWFYGVVGLATAAIAFTVVSVSSDDETKELATNSKNEASIKQKTPEKNSAIIVDLSKKTEEAPVVEPVVSEPTIAPAPVVEEPPSVERIVPEEPPVVEEIAKITQPHIAGVFNGPISFEDFCHPLGIQVNEDVTIAEYTIHYMSCTQEITVKIRGSKIPSEVCSELRHCGERIEIDFRGVKGYNKKTGKPVSFGNFTLIPTI